MKIGDLVKLPSVTLGIPIKEDNLGIVVDWDEDGNPVVEWIYPTLFWMNPGSEYKEDLIITSEA